MTAVIAVDLGATSGRVILGYVDGKHLRLEHVARFPNIPISTADGLHWNTLELFSSVQKGLVAATTMEPEAISVGVDSWGVDYGLLRGGRLLGIPYHYRDDRTIRAVNRVHAKVTEEALYRRNGIQNLPINTIFQLQADADNGWLELADSFLMTPDLFNFWLSGSQVSERTIASTTGLLDPFRGEWDLPLIKTMGFAERLFPELVPVGTALGPVLPTLGSKNGPIVTTIGSHDTASAVVAIPSTSDDSVYISCGTWALVGVETQSPIVSAASQMAGFTNEGGVDVRNRFQQNMVGLWLLSESLRKWKAEGSSAELAELLGAASGIRGRVGVFDVRDARFLAPGDMPSRIAGWCEEHGEPVPRTAAEFVRSIIESLATAFAVVSRDAAELSGVVCTTIHIVGGGSQNKLLCQRTADLSGLPVIAGPVEATAIGNILIQARAHGVVSGTLEGLRSIVSAAVQPRMYRPVRVALA